MMSEEWMCHGCGENKVLVDDGYEEKFCCGGGRWDACGCMGRPINQVFCESCETKIFGTVDKNDKAVKQAG